MPGATAIAATNPVRVPAVQITSLAVTAGVIPMRCRPTSSTPVPTVISAIGGVP